MHSLGDDEPSDRSAPPKAAFEGVLARLKVYRPNESEDFLRGFLAECWDEVATPRPKKTPPRVDFGNNPYIGRFVRFNAGKPIPLTDAEFAAFAAWADGDNSCQH